MYTVCEFIIQQTYLWRLSLLSAEMTPTMPRLQELYSVVVGTSVWTLYADDICRCRINDKNHISFSPEIAALSEIIYYRSKDNEIIYYR